MRLRHAQIASIALALAAATPSCEPLADSIEPERTDVPIFEASTPAAPPAASPKALKVMAYNIKFGAARIDFFFDYWGDRVQMTRREVESNLGGIERLLDETDPDVLLAEEVEVGSKRSAYVDMVQHILDHSRLRWAAYFSTWNSRYVAAEGLGRVDMGVAIFSRYPIKVAERLRLVDRTDQDFLTEIFYLHHALGRAVIDVGGRDVAAFVVHVEAYDQDGTKQRQLQQVYDLMAGETLPVLVGGDFNELPPTAVKLAHFDDEHPKSIGTEFEQPPYTPQAMQKFYDRYLPSIELARYGVTEDDQRPYYSHSVAGPDRPNAAGRPGFWNRTLDYLFVDRRGRWVPGTTDVLQSPGRLGIASDPMRLSDHAPVVGVWELPR